MTDVLISHSRKDTARAQAIARALETAGFSVFCTTKTRVSWPWNLIGTLKIRDAGCVVALWSTASTGSGRVLSAAAFGAKHHKLVLTLIDDAPIPTGSRNVHVASLMGWQGDPNHPGFRGLTAAIDRILESRGGIPEDWGMRDQPQRPLEGLSDAERQDLRPRGRTIGFPLKGFLVMAVLVAALVVVTFWRGEQSPENDAHVTAISAPAPVPAAAMASRTE